MTWQPPLIVQPTFGHPYCDRCGAVLVEEAKGRHVEWHRTVEGRSTTVELPAPSGLASRVQAEVSAE